MRYESPKLDPDQYHTITFSGRKGETPAVFLDYLKLKGVLNMDIRVDAGQPIHMHLEMIIAGVTSVEPES